MLQELKEQDYELIVKGLFLIVENKEKREFLSEIISSSRDYQYFIQIKKIPKSTIQRFKDILIQHKIIHIEKRQNHNMKRFDVFVSNIRSYKITITEKNTNCFIELKDGTVIDSDE